MTSLQSTKSWEEEEDLYSDERRAKGGTHLLSTKLPQHYQQYNRVATSEYSLSSSKRSHTSSPSSKKSTGSWRIPTPFSVSPTSSTSSGPVSSANCIVSQSCSPTDASATTTTLSSHRSCSRRQKTLKTVMGILLIGSIVSIGRSSGMVFQWIPTDSWVVAGQRATTGGVEIIEAITTPASSFDNAFLDQWKQDLDLSTTVAQTERVVPRTVYIGGGRTRPSSLRRQSNQTKHSHHLFPLVHSTNPMGSFFRSGRNHTITSRTTKSSDSEDTMERRYWPRHEVDPHCVPIDESWQSTFFPVCNEIHGFDMVQQFEDERLSLISSKGYWRLPWKMNETDRLIVWKTFK